MKNILIYDNEGIFVAGIQAILKSEKDMSVTAICSELIEIMKVINEHSPEILLINTAILKVEDIPSFGWIKRKYPALKIIFLLPKSDRNILIRGLRIGVEGFLLYESDAQYFVDSMRNIFNEDIILSGKLAKQLIEEVMQSRIGTCY